MSRAFKVLAGVVVMAMFGGSVQTAAPAFKGSGTGFLTGQEVLAPDHVVLTAVGVGHATHLGRFARVETLHLNPGTGAFSGSITFVAAIGDRLITDVSGQFASADEATGTYTVTGGTGRFAAATGQASFTVTRTSPETFVFWFDGGIAR